MEFLLSFFASAVFAAETILSPLADMVTFGPPPTPVPQPKISFGKILTSFVPPVLPIASTSAVLGDSIATSSASPEATPSPTIQTYATKQKHYALALLGDSMMDTLGSDAPDLKAKLRTHFPAASFTILNYGVGAENIDSGLKRITESYTYLGETKPSLVSQSPDIVVVESFAYNPYAYDVGALDQHWLQLGTIVTLLKNRLPNAIVIIAATIAPNSQLFGNGAPGISFSASEKKARTDTVKAYLDSTVHFAKGQHLPLADAYHPSLMNNGDGNTLYINNADHIHYSTAGRDLMAQTIVDTIIENKLLE